jgi:hypothetical protein
VTEQHDERRRRTLRPSRADDQLAELLHAASNLNDAAGQLRHGLKTIGAARQLGATPRIVVNGASQRLSASIGRLAGFSFTETTAVQGATAKVRLHDGIDVNGDTLMTITLGANESAREWFLPQGISFETGLYVEVISGSIEGTVFLA